MNNAIRSEWIKFRTVRANVVLIIIAIGAPLVLSVLIASLGNFDPIFPEDTYGVIVLVPGVICAYLAGVLGVLGIGQEYRHNTIRVTFAAEPRRSIVLAAKAIVYAAFGLSIALVTQLACLVFGSVILSARDLPFEVNSASFIGLTLTCGLFTLFGFGLGCILRQPAGAIPAFLVWPLVVENIVGAILYEINTSFVRWLPFRAGLRLAGSGTDFFDYFGRVTSGLYFTAWTAAVVGFGWWLVERRDA